MNEEDQSSYSTATIVRQINPAPNNTIFLVLSLIFKSPIFYDSSVGNETNSPSSLI